MSTVTETDPQLFWVKPGEEAFYNRAKAPGSDSLLELAADSGGREDVL